MRWNEQMWANFSKQVMKRLPRVFHVGRRAFLTTTKLYGLPAIEKRFDNTPEGRECVERELLSQRLYGGFSWMVPMVKRGPRKLAMPRYRDEQRLDRIAINLDSSTRAEIACQAVEIIWNIFSSGYAHRDFHTGNLFWIQGRLLATDFETLERYPDTEMPAFPESYDITGKGLPSPYITTNMGYASDHPMALQQVLGVTVEEALDNFRMRLKDCLRDVSLAFKTKNSRHHCKAMRIYSSFKLPHFEVTLNESQRNSARRMQNFGVTKELLKGRTVLDLGSNIGGMLFEAQKFEPEHSLGIEYDNDKVEVARQILRYTGLKNIRFEREDIDTLKCEDVHGPCDVVFCLAIEKHIKNPKQLYRFLAQVTSESLFFEGNAGTDIQDVARQLAGAGFKYVKHLGFSDDDCLPENNVRPLLVAARH